MSKPAKNNDTAKLAPDQLPYEEALRRLETIVEAMEAEDLPLESLVARYEEGVRLAQSCQRTLADAELKIKQLEQNAAGELQLKPVVLAENPSGD
ncbi:MAG: exodeoxyribonuclease VII small subunit [Verrucomicrobiota bacterium]